MNRKFNWLWNLNSWHQQIVTKNVRYILRMITQKLWSVKIEMKSFRNVLIRFCVGVKQTTRNPWRLSVLAVCYYHVTHAFQSESTFYNCLNVKETLAQNRRNIWSLSNSNGLVWLNGWVFVYELSGCGFESRCYQFWPWLCRRIALQVP